jgi:hypothetical protein
MKFIFLIYKISIGLKLKSMVFKDPPEPGIVLLELKPNYSFLEELILQDT